MNRQQECHYCGDPATSRDHIIARARLKRAGVTDIGVLNVVPSCQPCQEVKASGKPTCKCDVCKAAVRAFGMIKGEIAAAANRWPPIRAAHLTYPLSSVITELGWELD